jgi:hypothetical protein
VVTAPHLFSGGDGSVVVAGSVPATSVTIPREAWWYTPNHMQSSCSPHTVRYCPDSGLFFKVCNEPGKGVGVLVACDFVLKIKNEVLFPGPISLTPETEDGSDVYHLHRGNIHGRFFTRASGKADRQRPLMLVNTVDKGEKENVAYMGVGGMVCLRAVGNAGTVLMAGTYLNVKNYATGGALRQSVLWGLAELSAARKTLLVKVQTVCRERRNDRSIMLCEHCLAVLPRKKSSRSKHNFSCNKWFRDIDTLHQVNKLDACALVDAMTQ